MNNSRAETEKALARLREVRHRSLIATRQGDFRRVAQLASETMQLNLKLQNEGKSVFV